MRKQDDKLLFLERDRSVDVNVTELGTLDRIRYRKSDNSPTGSESHSTGPLSVRKQKRIPTGGKALPEREKPFTNSTFYKRSLAGSFWQNGSTTYDKFEGVLSGVYALGSWPGFSSVSGSLSYPMENGGQIKIDYRSDGVAYPNPDILSQAEVKCYNKFGDKVGDPGLQPGIWYGERRETAHLLRQGAVGIFALASAIARKDYAGSARVLRDVFRVSATPKGERARVRRLERWLKREVKNAPGLVKRTLRNIEDAVLGYNLGVSPLISDLKSAHQRLLTGDLTQFAEKTGFKAVARHSVPFQGVESKTNPKSGVSAVTTVAGFKGYTVTMKARPVDTDLARLSRLGLTSPISLAYQLTGLTFLLDYFVALGPWLDALNTPMGYQFIDGSYGLRIVQNITCTVKSPGNCVARGWSSFDHFERKVYGSFPFPIPPLSLRGRDLSVKQATNASLVALKKTKSLLGIR